MIEIRYDGRPVVTAAQAVARSDRWPTPGAFRAWVARNKIVPATHLDPRTPLYYPEDLGLEET